ncbi:hypothetical protein Ae201684P_013385 [Aphanomyces euteiches]|nr:hypothetical protein Ae201684P_013385 [Aphanomyces euteiches]
MPTSKPNLTDEQSAALYLELAKRSCNGMVSRGIMEEVCSFFSVTSRTSWRIWKRGNDSHEVGQAANVRSKIKGHSGRRRVYAPSDIEAKVKAVELHKRQTYGSLAKETGLSEFLLWSYVKAKWMNRRSNWARPALSDQQRACRLAFCKNFVDMNYASYDVVHVDEKWFFMAKIRRKFLLWHDEAMVPRHVQNKSHITKVMFLVAVARPRGDWDGKVGCWPFVTKVQAQRTSRNRRAGELVLTPVSVTGAIYREYLCDLVLPAIKHKWAWPSNEHGTIFNQQDNAPAHSRLDDAEILAACNSDGWNIEMRFQPAKSPDLNVLDLGFFNSIQALQQRFECGTIEELIDAVKISFHELERLTLEKTFRTLHRVMQVIIEFKGDNRFKIPRSKKNEDESLALQLMHARIEEEERMDSLADLFGTVRFGE